MVGESVGNANTTPSFINLLTSAKESMDGQDGKRTTSGNVDLRVPMPCNLSDMNHTRIMPDEGRLRILVLG